MESSVSKVKIFLRPEIEIFEKEHFMEVPLHNPSEAIKANAYYFNHPKWAEEYLTFCHRSESFRKRWQAAVEDWNDKIVLDIGCGPGNIFATLKGQPQILIGVDVATTSLQMAGKLGYIPVLANAANLPFQSAFADIVTLNATLHHCENIEAVLKEAARLVKPGGLIVTDHDPQLSAWDYKGLAKLLWKSRIVLYRLIKHGFHKSTSQQYWALASEVHHKPGRGVTKELFNEVLDPLGFDVKVFPHNHELGEEVLTGKKGRAEFKYRLGNWLSGRNPNADKSALSLMCVARRRQSVFLKSQSKSTADFSA